MDAPTPTKFAISKAALLGLAASAIPMLWYPKYLLIAFFAVLGQVAGAWTLLLLGYPAFLFAAFLISRTLAGNVAASTAIALSPLLVLVGIALVTGQPISFLFSY